MTSVVEVDRARSLIEGARSWPVLFDVFLYAYASMNIANAMYQLAYEWSDPLVAVILAVVILAWAAMLVVLLMPAWLARFLATKGFPRSIRR